MTSRRLSGRKRSWNTVPPTSSTCIGLVILRMRPLPRSDCNSRHFPSDSPRVDSKAAEAEFSEDRGRAQVPARPCERRIAVRVPSVDDGPRVEKELNRLLGAECGGPVEGR